MVDQVGEEDFYDFLYGKWKARVASLHGIGIGSMRVMRSLSHENISFSLACSPESTIVTVCNILILHLSLGKLAS